jgi:hypothetical protein
MVEITLPIILQFIQTAGILVGIIYYITIMRNQQRTRELTLETRQTHLFMEIYKIYASKEFQRDLEQMKNVWKFEGYDDFFEKYDVENNPDAHAIWDHAVRWHEGLGLLVRKGLIDPESVNDLMGIFGPLILEFRERRDAPLRGNAIEYLHDAIKEIRDRKLSTLT